MILFLIHKTDIAELIWQLDSLYFAELMFYFYNVKRDSLHLLANTVELCLNYDDDYIKRVDKDLQKSSIEAKASIIKLEEWLRNVK